MNISKKRKKMIFDAIDDAFNETIEETFTEGEMKNAPDQWDEWTTKQFDTLSEMQSKACKKIKEIFDK